MNDVAVLLNLTPRLTFEETDPLMSLVTKGEALLFYDRLSVEKVRVEVERGRDFLRERVIKLRNLLESRALSKDDDNERIRLIVTLDLWGGLLQPSDGPVTLPAGKALEVRRQIQEVFGSHNPLLRRLSYCFVFVYSNARDEELRRFFSEGRSGLDADDFRGQCTFFVMKADNTPLRVKRTDETFVKSLVQLLSTMSPGQFDNQVLSPYAMPANVFVAGDNDRGHIMTSSFGTLNGMVGACKPLLAAQSWSDDREVSYDTYTATAESSTEIDSYTSLNNENNERREKLHDRFCETRELPFFFGAQPGDWSWYEQVLKEADEMSQFEQEHDRPLHEEPKRITEKEMSLRRKKCTYSALIEQKRLLEKKEIETHKPEELDTYLRQRHELIDAFREHTGKLRKELLKLGFLSHLLWISILSSVVFTLCYAFHFFLPDNTDKPYWIVACLVAIALLFVLAALIGGACVRKRVNRVYDRMDELFEKMKAQLQRYLEGVKKSIDCQREADVLKRNLDEMRDKLEEFDRHNKRVEIWMHHYDGLIEKLNNAMETFDVPADSADMPVLSKTSTVFYLDDFPCLPNTVSDAFKGMSTRLTNNGTDLRDVTCFVNQFSFVQETQ